MRDTSDRLTFLRRLEEKPYEYDFYQTLRRIECLYADMPRIGQALRPADEPIRLGQEASMSFAPAPIAGLQRREDGRAPRLLQRIFGLLGPNGPLPLHLTDYARERMIHHGDETFARFLDLFNHRLLELFYRAWAAAQPAVSLDRPREDRFASYVGSLIGAGIPQLRHRDAAGDFVKLYFSGVLARSVRNADGLRALLAGYFRLPVAIEQFVAGWMSLPPSEHSRLGSCRADAQLGAGTVLGKRVWDRQHRFRVHLGPLTLAQYEAFLPGGTALSRLVALVRQYLCFELDWDVRLVLVRTQVPGARLGVYGRLGWTTWLGRARGDRDPADVLLDAEALAAREQEPAQTQTAASHAELAIA